LQLGLNGFNPGAEGLDYFNQQISKKYKGLRAGSITDTVFHYGSLRTAAEPDCADLGRALARLRFGMELGLLANVDEVVDSSVFLAHLFQV